MSLIYKFLPLIQKISAAETGEEQFRNAKSVGEYVTLLYKIGIPICLGLGGLVIIYAGYIYATSQGNPDSIKTAKDFIIGALVGIALIILAGVILRNIIGINYQ